MPTISVSKYVKKKIDDIKTRNGHTSHDSVIRTLESKDVGTKVKCGQLICIHNKNGFCTHELIAILQGTVGCVQFEQRTTPFPEIGISTEDFREIGVYKP